MKKYLLLVLKGIGMGAADVVPGVSGGTIAFITGIYEELVGSIKSINGSALKELLKGNFTAFWKMINGSFLISVFAGILISVLSLARLMQYLLHNHPVQIWSFFMGLIAYSAIYVLKDVKKWGVSSFLTLLFGIGAAAFISLVSPASTTEAYWFIFLSGMIGICAMILPGISGSFILLLLGKYQFIMQAISDLNIPVLIVFAAGALIGIISFSHFLSWLLKKYYSQTICLLSGFMVGSLIKVWPWKLASGAIESIDKPVSPAAFNAATGIDPMLTSAIIFAIIGASLVFIIEFIAKYMQKIKK